MRQHSAISTPQPRVLSDAELDLVQGGIGMASTAAKPLLPVILKVIEKYTSNQPASPAS